MAAARRRRRLQQPQPAARKLGASPYMLDKLSIVGNAHVRVQSRAVDQVLVPDVELSGGEVRFLELIRSPESACAELERLAAKRLLATAGTAELSQETRQHLETYARSVLSKSTEELRARGQQRLKQMTDALRQAGKAIDSATLPPDQAEKLKGFTGKAQKRIDGVDQWLHSLDRERKGERPAPKGKLWRARRAGTGCASRPVSSTRMHVDLCVCVCAVGNARIAQRTGCAFGAATLAVWRAVAHPSRWPLECWRDGVPLLVCFCHCPCRRAGTAPPWSGTSEARSGAPAAASRRARDGSATLGLRSRTRSGPSRLADESTGRFAKSGAKRPRRRAQAGALAADDPRARRPGAATVRAAVRARAIAARAGAPRARPGDRVVCGAHVPGAGGGTGGIAHRGHRAAGDVCGGAAAAAGIRRRVAASLPGAAAGHAAHRHRHRYGFRSGSYRRAVAGTTAAAGRRAVRRNLHTGDGAGAQGCPGRWRLAGDRHRAPRVASGGQSVARARRPPRRSGHLAFLPGAGRRPVPGIWRRPRAQYRRRLSHLGDDADRERARHRGTECGADAGGAVLCGHAADAVRSGRENRGIPTPSAGGRRRRARRGGVRGGARGRLPGARLAALRRASAGRPGVAGRVRGRDRHRRGQDAGGGAAGVRGRSDRSRHLVRGHGERLPGATRLRDHGAGVPLSGPVGRAGAQRQHAGGATSRVRLRHHLRDQLRAGFRLPARPPGAEAEGAQLVRCVGVVGAAGFECFEGQGAVPQRGRVRGARRAGRGQGTHSGAEGDADGGVDIVSVIFPAVPGAVRHDRHHCHRCRRGAEAVRTVGGARAHGATSGPQGLSGCGVQDAARQVAGGDAGSAAVTPAWRAGAGGHHQHRGQRAAQPVLERGGVRRGRHRGDGGGTRNRMLRADAADLLQVEDDGRDGASVRGVMAEWVRQTVMDIVPNFVNDRAGALRKLEQFFPGIALGAGDSFTAADFEPAAQAALRVLQDKCAALRQRAPTQDTAAFRYLALVQYDRAWARHLKELGFTRDFASLQSLKQVDPVQEFQRQGYALFQRMQDTMRRDTVYSFFQYDPEQAAR
eukprot:ctg_1623.g519